MGGLTAASVPLYRIFCAATGLWRHDAARRAPRPTTISERARHGALRHRDRARARLGVPAADARGQVHPGEQTQVFFRAVNRTAEPITGTAVYNVTPTKIGIYFDKLQCFCFSNQYLAPGESTDMGVVFFVDPDIAEGPRHARRAHDHAVLHDVPGGRDQPPDAPTPTPRPRHLMTDHAN